MYTPRMRNHRTAFRDSGFTLVEALVALVVLSIGMLGIAALYVDSLRTGRDAVTRSNAVMLASDMADRIRANRQGGANYVKAVTDVGTSNSNCLQGGTSGSCTSAVMAAHDISQWNTALAAALPSGTGSIAFVAATATTAAIYTITVNWIDSGQTLPVSYVLRVRA